MKTFNKSVVTLALLVFAAPVFAAEQEGVKCDMLRRTLAAIRKPAIVETTPVVERNPEGIVARIFAAIRKPAEVVPAVEQTQVAAPVVASVEPVVEQVSRNPEGVVARTLAAIRNEVPAAVQINEQATVASVPAVDANITLATQVKEVVQEATKESTQEAAQTTKSWLWSKTGQFVCAMKNAVEPFWMKCQKLQYEATKALDNKYVLAGVSAVATLATVAACYKGFKMYQAYRTNKALNVAARNKWASAFVIPR